jgi:hypothetical protein
MQGIAPTLIVARVALGINLKPESIRIPPEHSGEDLRFGSTFTSDIMQDRTMTILPDYGRRDSAPMESVHEPESV